MKNLKEEIETIINSISKINTLYSDVDDLYEVNVLFKIKNLEDLNLLFIYNKQENEKD
jgi:hypothetical protein